MLRRLPAIELRATIITSSVAHPLLSTIFGGLGEEVNVIAADKEIGGLFTIEDFERLDLREVSERVIIPGRTLAHDMDITRALRRDGRKRLVFRGPDELTVVSERSIYNTKEEVLAKEIEAFTGLIMQINEIGLSAPVAPSGKIGVKEGVTVGVKESGIFEREHLLASSQVGGSLHA